MKTVVTAIQNSNCNFTCKICSGSFGCGRDIQTNWWAPEILFFQFISM